MAKTFKSDPLLRPERSVVEGFENRGFRVELIEDAPTIADRIYRISHSNRRSAPVSAVTMNLWLNEILLDVHAERKDDDLLTTDLTNYYARSATACRAFIERHL